MKILFTEVIVENRSGTLTGLAADYEITDSDGFGNSAVDSGSMSPNEGLEPTYASLAAVQALTQSQIYSQYLPSGTDSDGNSFADIWKEEEQESINEQIQLVKQETNDTIDVVDEITDQTPISI